MEALLIGILLLALIAVGVSLVVAFMWRWPTFTLWSMLAVFVLSVAYLVGCLVTDQQVNGTAIGVGMGGSVIVALITGGILEEKEMRNSINRDSSF